MRYILIYHQLKKNIKKLTDLRANPQIITAGSIAKKDNRVTINYDILNRKGEKLSPKVGQ